MPWSAYNHRAIALADVSFFDSLNSSSSYDFHIKILIFTANVPHILPLS